MRQRDREGRKGEGEEKGEGNGRKERDGERKSEREILRKCGGGGMPVECK